VYDRARLRRLYGTYRAYARRFDAAKKEAVAQGFLLPTDARRLAPVARPSDF